MQLKPKSHQMTFMNEHILEAERLAMDYKRDAYKNCWIVLSSALDKLK